MSAPSLKYTYHDASIVEVVLGPRNALQIQVALDPIWNTAPSVVLRFGAIANLGEVAAYLGRIPPRAAPDAYLARIERLECRSAKRNRTLLQLEGIGVLEIDSLKVSESAAV
jgi:hypothetical protein